MPSTARIAITGKAIGYALLVIPLRSLAAVKIENPLGTADFKTVIVRIADFFVAIAIPLTTLMIIFAAYLYLTGGANPDQIKKAHKVIIWAIVGLVVILIAASVSTLIETVLQIK